jgi:hypothetical protein
MSPACLLAGVAVQLVHHKVLADSVSDEWNDICMQWLVCCLVAWLLHLFVCLLGFFNVICVWLDPL